MLDVARREQVACHPVQRAKTAAPASLRVTNDHSFERAVACRYCRLQQAGV